MAADDRNGTTGHTDEGPAFDFGMTAGKPASGSGAYRVLARKYRPAGFEGMIGQDAMVRTLENAFKSGRIAHAIMLTGVRGVGKTTTARIIAKALNCVGPDGALKDPTTQPCGACPPCREIAESRAVDVQEMDAASNTGIDDIREIVDGVRYAPASLRYKVYIIDEVHMLSKAAFNGLLKTLEEPPPHVKFVFATTEIRKVPVTVLSRCQRFDLKRISLDDLRDHLTTIVAAEGLSADPQALTLIARAAQGSARDALSLLDQAMAHAGEGAIEAEPVRQMLGLADRTRIIDLFENLMSGALPEALAEFRSQFDAGADPLTVIQDLLALTHELTRAHIVPDGAMAGWAEAEAARGRALAQKLSIPTLARSWQILLKGAAEVQTATDGAAGAEMVLIRAAHAANLPPTDELIRRAAAEMAKSPGTGAPQPASPSMSGPRLSIVPDRALQGSHSNVTKLRPEWDERPQISIMHSADMQEAAPQAVEGLHPAPPDWRAVAELAGAMRAIRLKYEVENNMSLVSFARGRIEIVLRPRSAPNITGDLAAKLSLWTGERWIISVSSGPGEATLAEKAAETREARLAAASQDPMLKAALQVFPGAKIIALREREGAEELPTESEDDR